MSDVLEHGSAWQSDVLEHGSAWQKAGNQSSLVPGVASMIPSPSRHCCVTMLRGGMGGLLISCTAQLVHVHGRRCRIVELPMIVVVS